jgi:hypothetical protein
MSQDRTTELPNLLAEVTEPPDYQRFIALNIQVPQIKGQRIYHRVTITSSLKDLAADLSLTLPLKVRRILEKQSEVPSYKGSRCELPSPNPNHDPYVAICSCGQKDCEHIEYAIRHFQLAQRLSEDSGRISHLIQQAMEAEQTHRKLENELLSIEQKREELAKKLESEERAGKQVAKLRKEVGTKDSEIVHLRSQLEHRDEEQERLRREIRTHRENFEAVLSEFWRGKDKPLDDTPKEVSDEMLYVLTRHFMLPLSSISPEDKFQKNVFADHHRVPNTMGLLRQLADIDFIRELGIGQRHNTKSGKVRIKPEVERLELLIPHEGEADIVRIITTASSKSQQFFAAYFIGERLGVEVQP